MDVLHSAGVRVAQHLQSAFNEYEDWFMFASNVADLHTPYFVFFPIWFHLQSKVGVKLVWVAVIGDWLNLVLKWVLFGERPYWWVHETEFYGSFQRPVLKQFPVTCETGPGSPSGHAMGSAGVWYVMISAILTLASQRNHSTLQTGCLRVLLWSLFCTIELLVCMARVYLAAHFPHQVIAGVISGILVAELFDKIQWIYGASLKKYVITTVFLFSFALGFYLLLKVVGVDLLWTLEKAKRWCVRPDWVHMDTTPFASLLRNLGTLFGLGLALSINAPLYQASYRGKWVHGTPFRLGCIVVSLLALRLLDLVPIPEEQELLLYALSFCKSAAVPLMVVWVVPGCLSQLFTVKKKKAQW
uniref:Glucose-6-phosphatase n=1 Tax=Erpetoichthys calabaricus TaxID=27687 RepID=A0A8C4TEE3_ERPCA